VNDLTNGTISIESFQLTSPAFPAAGAASGSLSFAAVSTPVPEPSSVTLIIAGIGFLLMLMRKRLAHGPTNKPLERIARCYIPHSTEHPLLPVC
jgi:hypothetical protein